MSLEILYKTCVLCNEKKTLDFFYAAKGYLYNKESRCISCLKEFKKKYKLSETAILNAKERSRVYRKNNPEKFKLSVKFSSYKKLGLDITKEEYHNLLDQQDNKCAICNKTAEGFKKSLCLDHCHATLKVRGFLCDNCNAGLGKFKDNPELLNKAVKYLNKLR
jgi:hypothetical protein